MLPNERIIPLFPATVQATEAAITNALLAAETMTGANDLRVYALPRRPPAGRDAEVRPAAVSEGSTDGRMDGSAWRRRALGGVPHSATSHDAADETTEAGDDGPSDRELGLDRPIDRRDFLNGLAVGMGALGSVSPADLLRHGILDATTAQDYPPARTGLRGSHDGAFEDAHRVRDGMAPKEWSTPTDLRERYDLIVVGAGISGLSAAHFYQQRAGTGARILILDNHDDFGGHARRNEFTVDGKPLITYAGTQSIDTPSRYSPEATQFLRTLGVETGAFDTLYDQELLREAWHAGRRLLRQGDLRPRSAGPA